MPDNPYDEIFRNLTRMMEDILKNIPAQASSHVVHYTIIAEPGEAPRVFQQSQEELDEEVPYETIETDDCIYITVEIASADEACVEIGSRSVTIWENDEETIIEIDCEIDPDRSAYNIHRGILDIVCYKK